MRRNTSIRPELSAMRRSHLRNVIAAMVIALTMLAAVPASASQQTTSATNALTWLRANALQCDGSITGLSTIGGTADGVFAIVAGGQDAHTWGTSCAKTPVSYLKSHAADAGLGAGSLGKIAIAAKISSENPRNFGGINLIDAIKNQQAAPGRYGIFLFDQSFAMLALASTGETVPDAATADLLSLQNADGGWSFTGVPDQASDTNSTAIALQALFSVKARGSALSGAIDLSAKRSVAFFHKEQNLDGGFGFQKAWGTDSTSTANSVQSLMTIGEDPKGPLWQTVIGSNSPMTTLLSLQRASGAFAYQAGGDNDAPSTSQSIPGILEKSFLCLTGLATCPSV
ncbi:MAG: hypothetical protein ABR507_11220 [Actinomycetota bacterium]|nr:hypothetical protein [Actinomycetota bacterium]